MSDQPEVHHCQGITPPAKRGSRRTVQKKKGGRIVLRTEAFEIELDLPDLVLAQIERLFERGER